MTRTSKTAQTPSISDQISRDFAKAVDGFISGGSLPRLVEAYGDYRAAQWVAANGTGSRR